MEPENPADPENIIINPTIEVELVLTYRTVDRGPMRLSLDFADADDVEFARNLCQQSSRELPTSAETLQLDRETLDIAIDTGLVVPAEQAPRQTRAPDLSLDDYRPSIVAGRARDGAIVVNRDVWHQHDWLKHGRRYNNWYFRLGDNPADILGLDDSTLYVKHPDSLFISVVNLHGRTRRAWQQLSAGTITPDELDPDLRARLADASLLIPRARTLAQRIEAHADELRANEFTVLRGVVNPVFCQWLTEYSLARLNGGWLNKEQEYEPRNRWMLHNDPIMQTVHTGLTPFVRAVAARIGKPCRPSYSFLGIYERGALLERHTDREQSRWNLSLLLGTRPEVPLEHQWPIYIEASDTHCVRAAPGDAVMYSGVNTPHWREVLSSVDRYVVCLLFYVDEDFLGYTD